MSDFRSKSLHLIQQLSNTKVYLKKVYFTPLHSFFVMALHGLALKKAALSFRVI